jgi:hypothetical protein
MRIIGRREYKMKNFKQKTSFLLAIGLLLFVSVMMTAANDIPKSQLPLLNTSAGQSADVETLNVICEEAGVKYDYCDVPTTDLIKAGVGLAGKESGPGFHVEVHTDLAAYPEGTPYKTIIFAIGASLKGMGASGLTVDAEVKRLKEIIEYCKQNKIFIIAMHAAGTSGRGAPGSDNEKMIDAVAPFADFIIVAADSNKDGRFDSIAKDKGIPITQVEYALEIVDVIKQVFE